MFLPNFIGEIRLSSCVLMHLTSVRSRMSSPSTCTRSNFFQVYLKGASITSPTQCVKSKLQDSRKQPAGAQDIDQVTVAHLDFGRRQAESSSGSQHAGMPNDCSSKTWDQAVWTYTWGQGWTWVNMGEHILIRVVMMHQINIHSSCNLLATEPWPWLSRVGSNPITSYLHITLSFYLPTSPFCINQHNTS